MAAVTAYTARLTREGKWWVIDVPGVGVTQARTIEAAGATARDLVALMTDTPVEKVDVTVELSLGAIRRDVERLQKQQRDLDRLAREASARSRALASTLHSLGLGVRDIGVVLNLSPQRVSQLMAGAAARPAAPAPVPRKPSSKGTSRQKVSA
jgi:hypothetical protein